MSEGIAFGDQGDFLKKKMVAIDHEFASAAHTAVSGKPKTSNIAPWNPKNFKKLFAKFVASAAMPERLQRIHGAPPHLMG